VNSDGRKVGNDDESVNGLTAGDFENWRLVNEALVLNHEGFWKHNVVHMAAVGGFVKHALVLYQLFFARWIGQRAHGDEKMAKDGVGMFL
jgi:hypothetical protein